NLSEADTHILLHKAPDVYGARTDVLLLAALFRAICRWTGQPQALIGLEGHGREELDENPGKDQGENLFGDIDLSKTMGWFTSFFPVLLKMDGAQGLPETVAAVREQVDAIPNRGMGYGVLRYMASDPDIRETLTALPSPQVIFNYFGQVDETFVAGDVAFEKLGFSESPRRTRQNMIDIGGGVINGRLQLAVSYCSKIHKEDTIRRVTDDVSTALHKLIHGTQGRKQAFIHKALPQFPELVYLNKGTTGVPVFWIHGGLGGVGAYVKLARRIQKPFYGIQARGWMTDRAPLEGVRRKAAYYLRIIRAVQPEGPYHLGGYSYGGKVAYEMTRQLQAMGESVASIVMLDSLVPPESDPEGTPGTFNRKEAMLQAVNAVLIESTFSGRRRPDEIMIHRSELDTELADDQFMTAISEHPKTLAVFKTGEKAAVQIRGIAAAIEKSREEHFTVRPLPEPDAVTCRFFRDKSGDMFGNLAPYFSFENRDQASKAQISKERAGNCDLWKANISDFRLTDVDSPNHMAMLTDPTSFEEIARGCEALYAENKIHETILN
ncbi:MAG: thioesterase domain-containing protein, partial [Desulfobacterales bacterium]|nr:thioesterase domain-containing protein [Desulfobacterales bacterium]